MKKTVVFGLIVFMLSCKAQLPSKEELTLTSACPKDGTCQIELHKNKSLVVVYDNFGGMYYELKETDGKSVIHFQYNKTTEANLQDGHYREDLLLEINNNIKALNLQNAELQQTKLIFGRHCFCKGQTGYFKVVDGELNANRKGSKLFLSLTFKTKKTSQIITKLMLNN
jgi:hypothetical protein